MSTSGFMEKLLDGAEVEWKPLGEVTEIKRGTSITKRQITSGEIPVIAGSGAYAGFVSWWEQPIFVSDAFSHITREK